MAYMRFEKGTENVSCEEEKIIYYSVDLTVVLSLHEEATGEELKSVIAENLSDYMARLSDEDFNNLIQHISVIERTQTTHS